MGKVRSVGDAGEYAFTRAAGDELRDAAQTYGVYFAVRTELSEQRGVWYTCVEAFEKLEGEPARRIASYRGSWPNPRTISYGAFLYQCCHRVCRMVESWDEANQIVASERVS